MTTNERFDEFYYNKDYDASAHEILTFIAQEKNLLLDQAIEIGEKMRKNYSYELKVQGILAETDKYEIEAFNKAIDQYISKLKELKE